MIVNEFFSQEAVAENMVSGSKGASVYISHHFSNINVPELNPSDPVFVGKYGWINNDIAIETLLTDKETFGKKDMAVFYFKRRISPEEAINKIEEAGYSPATMMELVAYAENEPEFLKRFRVVALGSSIEYCGVTCVPVLGEGEYGERRLYFFLLYGDWHIHDMFLAVRK